jgi:hypothetical protein
LKAHWKLPSWTEHFAILDQLLERLLGAPGAGSRLAPVRADGAP